MTLSDIKREQANAAATLQNIDAYVATLHPALYDHNETIWFLIEEAEGAFIQLQDCATAMGLELNNQLPIDVARAYIKSAINKARK
jgi:hypothetical protein